MRPTSLPASLFLTFLVSCTVSEVLPVHLTVSPSRSQFFRGESVILICEDENRPDGWTVRRNTTKGTRTECGDKWGEADGSTCNMTLFQYDTGVYWCESRSGSSGGGGITSSSITSSSISSSIQLSVSGGSVILQSPVLPVMEGDDVTLSCRARNPTHNLTAAFHKDGVFIGNESSGNLILLHVSSSDEGLYKCNIRGHGESPSSRISVKAKPAGTPPSSGAAPSASGPVQLTYTVLRHLLVFCPYFISTIIMVLLYQPRALAENNLESSPPPESEQGTEVKVEITANNYV